MMVFEVSGSVGERSYTDSLTGAQCVAPSCVLSVYVPEESEAVVEITMEDDGFTYYCSPSDILAAYTLERELRQHSSDPYDREVGSWMGAWLEEMEHMCRILASET